MCSRYVVEYPTASAEIIINGVPYQVKAGVSATLPRPVLLGRDIGNLLQLPGDTGGGSSDGSDKK